jgi:hypothetical protein
MSVEKPLLQEQGIYPTNEVLQDVLGNSYAAYEVLTNLLTNGFGFDSVSDKYWKTVSYDKQFDPLAKQRKYFGNDCKFDKITKNGLETVPNSLICIY